MVLTVKQLKEHLENYSDDMEVLIFVGPNGKPRKITKTIKILSVDAKEITGIALEVER